MAFTPKIKTLLKNDWVIGLFLLLVFLATNGYTYAWDDQHLEIPLLQKLIDPSLYQGDYYVDALTDNFASFLYPLLAKIITLDQIPAAYLLLYLLSRFFFLYFAYKLWRHISQDRLTGVLCVLSGILLLRVDEFLYRTFSHQEFALAVIMAAIYYFYRNRYITAAAMFGVAANFHALYSAFPFFYMLVFLLWKAERRSPGNFLKSLGVFVLCAGPFIIWEIRQLGGRVLPDPSLTQNWLELYKIACPQNFLFQNIDFAAMLRDVKTFFAGSRQFWPAMALAALNYSQHSRFRADAKTQAALITAAGLLVLSFFFTYVLPNRFVLDLNLVRNLQFIQFFLTGYATILIVEQVRSRSWPLATAAIVLFSLLRFGHYAAALAIAGITLILVEDRRVLNPLRWVLWAATAAGAGYLFKTTAFSHSALLTAGVIISASLAVCALGHLLRDPKWQVPLRTALILVPFVALSANYLYYHQRRITVERTGTGFWQLQRNWIDMQKFVQANTERSALILVPNDMEMGGFRIFSRRKVLVCYRDCGVVGFSYPAALEWQQRLKDVEHFKVFVDGDIKPALANAIFKYKANYIVFMRYLKPQANSVIEPVYENETFALFRVVANQP